MKNTKKTQEAPNLLEIYFALLLAGIYLLFVGGLLAGFFNL